MTSPENRIGSDNLELVTVLMECVSAAGDGHVTFLRTFGWS